MVCGLGEAAGPVLLGDERRKRQSRGKETVGRESAHSRTQRRTADAQWESQQPRESGRDKGQAAAAAGQAKGQ